MQILQSFFLFFAHGGQPWLIRLFSGLKLLQIIFQSDQYDCWMIMHDSVQRDAVCVRDLNIASSEYRTDDIDLGRANRSAVWTTLLLLNLFAGRGSSVRCASVWYAAGRGFHPHFRHILLEGEWSWKIFYDHYLPSADSRKGSCQLLAKEYALTINCLGGLQGNSVDRLTDRTRNDLKSVEEP